LIEQEKNPSLYDANAHAGGCKLTPELEIFVITYGLFCRYICSPIISMKITGRPTNELVAWI
jgi:hypothetical protein